MMTILLGLAVSAAIVTIGAMALFATGFAFALRSYDRRDEELLSELEE